MSDIRLTNKWSPDFKSGFNISKQVCNLINKYNQLGTVYRPENILSRSNDYLLFLSGDEVLGCIKIEKQSYTVTEIKHVSVIKKYRKIGFAKVLIKAGLNKITTPLIYATVRETNLPSLRLFKSFDFDIGGNYFISPDEKILALIKTNIHWIKNEFTPRGPRRREKQQEV